MKRRILVEFSLFFLQLKRNQQAQFEYFEFYKNLMGVVLFYLSATFGSTLLGIWNGIKTSIVIQIQLKSIL